MSILDLDSPYRTKAPSGLHTITLSTSPPNAGSASGEGTASDGMVVSVSAEGGGEQFFDHWQENGEKVSTANPYTFKVDRDRSLVANFVSVQVFGVCWDYGNPSTKLERLTPDSDPHHYVTTAITEEPQAAVGNSGGSSPFDAYMPWAGMEEYNIINNEVKYKRGADDEFSRRNYETVVYIPEFWVKVVDDASANKRYYYIANAECEEFERHPGSGKYVSRYTAALSYLSKNDNISITNVTRAAAREAVKKRGPGWQLYDFATYCALVLLYLVEYADWNSQAMIGRGYVDGNSAALPSGATDDMTYHTGIAGENGKSAMQYRHVENMWGNLEQWVDGINFNDRLTYICLNPANYADDTNANYTDTGISLPTNGYITGLGYDKNNQWAIIPDATIGGSDAMYTTDYVWSNTGWRVLSVGGGSDYAHFAGMLCVYASNLASASSINTSVRIVFEPVNGKEG